jgi:hypothetical protein
MTDFVVRRARDVAVSRASNSGDSLQVIVGMPKAYYDASQNTIRFSPAVSRGAGGDFGEVSGEVLRSVAEVEIAAVHPENTLEERRPLLSKKQSRPPLFEWRADSFPVLEETTDRQHLRRHARAELYSTMKSGALPLE